MEYDDLEHHFEESSLHVKSKSNLYSIAAELQYRCLATDRCIVGVVVRHVHPPLDSAVVAAARYEVPVEHSQGHIANEIRTAWANVDE